MDQDKGKTIDEIDVEAYFENLEKQGELFNPDVVDKLIKKEYVNTFLFSISA